MITDTPRSTMQPLLDILHGEIAVLDGAGRIDLVNKAWRERQSGGSMVWGDVGDNYLSCCEPEIGAAIRAVLEHGAHDYECDYPCRAMGGQRWFSVRFAPFSAAGRHGALVTHMDISERKRLESRHEFLARASDLLASSLDYEETIAQVVELAVPRMADLCTVHLLDLDGSIRRLAAAHYDPAKQRLVRKLLKDAYQVPSSASWGVAGAIRTGRPEIALWPQEYGEDETDHIKLLYGLGIRSVMVVPLISRERTIGAIAFIHGDSGRTYVEADLEIAQQLADRAASAIDNARLYREARESESRFRAIIEHVPAITYAARADDLTALTYVSSQAKLPESLFNEGVVIDESGWTSQLHPDDFERVRDVMRACSASGEPLEIEYRIVNPDGETAWRLDRARLIRDDAGRPLSWQGIVVDLSERKQAQAEREQLLRDLGERVKELTVLHRAAALFERDDVPLDRILRELAGMLPGAMQSPEMAAARVSIGDQWAETDGYARTPWTLSKDFPVPGGGHGAIEVTYIDPQPHDGPQLFLTEERSLIHSLAEMFAAFLERIDGQQRLRASEARIRAATEGTLDAFGILEPVRDGSGAARDYRFVEVNARAEVLLKKTRAELIGATLSGLFAPEQACMFIDAFNHVTATGETIEHEVEVPRETDSFWMHFQAVPLADGVAAFASETTERRRLEQQLVYQAFHDALTGLPNRALFLDRVDHALGRVRRRQEGVAVMFLDLDNFKFVNDSLGHSAGDELLSAVGRRLVGCIDPGDTVARIGGDEFAILLEDLTGSSPVQATAETLIAAFDAPFNILGREVFTTPSIGVAVAAAPDAAAGDLLRDADAAMYRAKRNGKARVEVFDPSLTDSMLQRFEIEHDLRRAIERGEIVVYFQPIVSLHSSHPVCMEALVRWAHPGRGLLPPARFIPIAEETGLIIPIGNFVLREACAQTVAWNRHRPADQQQTVSVNLSRRQFRDPELAEQVTAVLRETGLPPGLLYLEITESLMVEDEAAVRDTLQRLRALGVHLAVDDFGTGYSALGSLRQFPVEMVKIDRVFVSGIETNEQDAVMLAGIIDLAHALNLWVVAEGVETAGERDRLREMGCDLAQGHFFSRPLPARELEILASRR